MKILILTLGTRGDIQPFVALAQGLQNKGHQAVIAAPHRFGDFIQAHGIVFAGVDEGPMRIMDSAKAGEVVEGGLKARMMQAKTMPAMFQQALEDCWQIATKGRGKNADMVVHNGQILAGQHIAEALHIPAVLALPLPTYVPTKEFAWAGASMPRSLPGFLNKLTYLGMKGPELMFGKVIDEWRQNTLRLPKRKGRHNPLVSPNGQHSPVLHAFSPSVIQPPEDWPPEVVATGYWTLQEEPAPLSKGTAAFVRAGEPPVFVGFGSMLGKDPGRVTRAVLEAAKQSGKRLVVGAGWGGLAADISEDHVHVVKDVDHRSLFPHMAVIVHHGGAGTTGAAFAAGKPQVICPFVGDQPFWAHQAHMLGVASEPIPQRNLRAENLARAIKDTGSKKLQQKAAALAKKLRNEDGVRAAIARLERVNSQSLA